jgi:beta-carotene ketolase (CrtO type)
MGGEGSGWMVGQNVGQNEAVRGRLISRSDDDYDAIVIGAGHNGLITAAYLARAGLSTLLIEARDSVGGTASSERFCGATVNICNCDHITFRTTPVIEELALKDHGLEYLDVEPAQHHAAWSDGATWTQYFDVAATLESIGAVCPNEVEGYRRYLKAAKPAVSMIFEAASAKPTATALTRLAIKKRMAGAKSLMRWSRLSAADVLRSFFDHDALAGTAAVGGPMVWGVSPELPGTGLGALSHAMRHVGKVGRPVGGSGAMPEAIRSAYEAAGGRVLTGRQVAEILCEDDAVRGVKLTDGNEHRARVVISACDPHSTFLEWLKNPPPVATKLVNRWRNVPHHDGFESKIDAVLTTPPILRSIGRPTASTMVIAPSLAEIDDGYRQMLQGEVPERPGLLVNVPTVLDPSMAPPENPNRHVLSLEVLYTPFRLKGGWPNSGEPARWLDLFSDLCEPGFLDSIVEYRAMTPDIYERDFNLPAGHATSFSGGPLAVFRRKDPELTHYETAVTGLFITGAATFPGAGIWGASGRNCAVVVLDRLGIR